MEEETAASAVAVAAVVAVAVTVIVVAAATATVTAVAAMATDMVGMAVLAEKVTVLSSAVPPQQCAANTTISLKRDAWQRCQRLRQACCRHVANMSASDMLAQH